MSRSRPQFYTSSGGLVQALLVIPKNLGVTKTSFSSFFNLSPVFKTGYIFLLISYNAGDKRGIYF